MVSGVLVDGNTSTCLTLPPPQDGIYIQSSLLVNDGCRNGPNINLHITLKEPTDCNQILATILIEKPTTTCSKADNCQLTSSTIEEGKMSVWTRHVNVLSQQISV